MQTKKVVDEKIQAFYQISVKEIIDDYTIHFLSPVLVYHSILKPIRHCCRNKQENENQQNKGKLNHAIQRHKICFPIKLPQSKITEKSDQSLFECQLYVSQAKLSSA